ncbi:MAG: helix-turn-helix domain-containing protein [Rhodospirillaceae bacterium]|nr:helix-turn-helix domain-containing protein [Rhodospirillaceae bacterium]
MITRSTGLVVQSLSTEAVPARQKYAFWKEAVCDLFVGLECSRSGDAPFFGTAQRRVVDWDSTDSVSFIEVASVAQQAARSQKHIRRSADAWLMLLVQTAGPAVLRQAGRTAVLGPGDMVLFDSTRDYDFAFDQPFRQLVLKVPHHRLARRLPPAAAWLGRSISSASPLGGVLAAHLAAVSRSIDSIEPAFRPGLLDRTLDLLAYTFAGLQSTFGDTASTGRRVLLARAMQYVEAHAGDPLLAPGDVAAALGISVGYLHRLFQGVDRSVSGYMREFRLARCREQLGSVLHAGEHVTEIAMRWGFNDMPHFSRVFRQAFGVSPREYRAAAAAARADAEGNAPRIGPGSD